MSTSHRVRARHRRWLAAAGASLVCLAALSGCESKVTLENFQQLKPGMSLAQVEAILGSGTEDTSGGGMDISGGGVVSGSRGPVDKTYVWKNGDKQVVVTFAKDRAVELRQTGLQ